MWQIQDLFFRIFWIFFFFFRIFFDLHLVESKDAESEDWENQRLMLYSLCILNEMSRLLTDKYIVMCELDG